MLGRGLDELRADGRDERAERRSYKAGASSLASLRSEGLVERASCDGLGEQRCSSLRTNNQREGAFRCRKSDEEASKLARGIACMCILLAARIPHHCSSRHITMRLATLSASHIPRKAGRTCSLPTSPTNTAGARCSGSKHSYAAPHRPFRSSIPNVHTTASRWSSTPRKPKRCEVLVSPSHVDDRQRA